MLFGDLNVKEILKRENTHIHIADSLCHTVKTNNTVKQLYSNLKNKIGMLST